MSTTTSKAEKTADVLYRYMRARHRFKEQVDRPLPAHELAVLIAEGKREFDEIYTNRNPNRRSCWTAKPMTYTPR